MGLPSKDGFAGLHTYPVSFGSKGVTTMVKGCGRLGRGLALGFGLMVAGVLCFGLDFASAQTKTPTTKKKTPEKDKDKTTDKTEKEAPPGKEEPESTEVPSSIQQVLKINEQIEAKWK